MRVDRAAITHPVKAGKRSRDLEHESALALAMLAASPSTAPVSAALPSASLFEGIAVKELAPILVSVAATFIALLSAAFAYVTARASLFQKLNEDELREIQIKLDSFYGPLVQMLQADHLLAQDLRSRQTDKSYRLLIKLFDKKWVASLSPGDRALVREVCHRGRRLEEFIREHGGMVDYVLIPYFARASAHFRILDLAHEGELGDDATPFVRYVYPTQLDPVLRLEVERLIARRDALRRKPTTALPSMAELVIPPDLALDDWPNPGGTRLLSLS